MNSKESIISNLNIESPVYSSKIGIDKPNQAPSNTENKTYSLGRKIFEGFFLVVMNLTVVGALANLEMLRGDRSFLKQEYQKVFADKEITLIKGSSSKTQKEREETKNQPQNSSQVDQTLNNDILDEESKHENTEDHVIEVHNNDNPSEQPNPIIGQPFSFSVSSLKEANSFTIKLVDLFVEVTDERPSFQSPPTIEGQSLLDEKNIIAVPQSTGLLSRVGSLFTRGINRVTSEVPEPQLHVEGTFVATFEKTEYVFTVTVKAPLSENISPEKLIEREILKQLPPEITHQHLPTLKYEGENVDTYQVLPSVEKKWPEIVGSAQDTAMIVARLASVSMLSRAVEFRLKNMPIPDTSHTADEALSWLSETTGMSTRLGFNPYGIAVAGVYASVRALSGRTKTKSLVHREISKNELEIEDRTITVVDPSTQKQDWLEYIYGCFTHTISTLGNVLRFTSTQNTRGIRPIYSETYFGNNGLTVRFDLREARVIGKQQRPNTAGAKIIGVDRATTPAHFKFSALSPKEIKSVGII